MLSQPELAFSLKTVARYSAGGVDSVNLIQLRVFIMCNDGAFWIKHTRVFRRITDVVGFGFPA